MNIAYLAYSNRSVNLALHRTDWAAIWGGVFTFLAIWTVFGALGLAIFASSANPNAATPVSGMSAGMGIWAIVLTIIAMYVAGRETGRLAGITNRHDGLIHGMMMFGLACAATVVLVTLGGAALGGGTGVESSSHSPYILGLFSELGWIGFAALFLGWLAAMFGAQSSVSRKVEANLREMRPAA